MLNKAGVLLFVAICLMTSLQAQVQLSPALQSRMVIQQNKPFRVWGTAPAGTRIQVQPDWQPTPTEITAAGDGQFMAIIEVPAARRGDFSQHQIRVQTKSASVVLT